MNSPSESNEERAKKRADAIEARAKAVERQFQLSGELYLLGSLERGVTVYSQQVRAHNLAWALWELDATRDQQKRNVAIIGGGITGLTAAACVLGLFPEARVTILEKSWDFCSLQQGCDSRWLHPRVYRWPEPESRAPSASLPILNWQEGRASDVADQILRGFARYCLGGKPKRGDRLSPYVGVEHLRISAANMEIEWVGRQAISDGVFYRAGEAVGKAEKFDRIILAVGFGGEICPPGYETLSYWQNEEFAQPRLDGSIHSYIVSGYGDGALVDLSRLTIERFRQDRIIYDLFEMDLDRVEEELLARVRSVGAGQSIFDLFKEAEEPLLDRAKRNLSGRIRKDTRVVLHLGGKHGRNSGVRDAFGQNSSFLNQLLLYLLYRRGAFTPMFGKLDDVSKNNVPIRNIICRHGPRPLDHVLGLFTDSDLVAPDLKTISDRQAQTTVREWEPGSFPS